MAGVASYRTVIKKSGTATVMTSEGASTSSTVANTYQINSTAKRIWDRTASFTFRKAGSTVALSDISKVDYLFGKVTFATPSTGAVTITGTYLPVSAIAGAHAYTLNVTRELLDDTDFTSTGWRSRQSGLLDAALTVTRYDAIELEFTNMINTGNPVVVEVRSGGGANLSARGFFVLEHDNRSGDVSALETADLSFMLDGDSKAAFSFNNP